MSIYQVFLRGKTRIPTNRVHFLSQRLVSKWASIRGSADMSNFKQYGLSTARPHNKTQRRKGEELLKQLKEERGSLLPRSKERRPLASNHGQPN